MSRATTLPKGAVLISPVRLELGHYVPLEYDAKLERNGLTWYRVQGGFGRVGKARGDREDWVADAPGVSATVCDYHWNGSSSFGLSYPSFEDALDGQREAALRTARYRLIEKQVELASLEEGIKRLEEAS